MPSDVHLKISVVNFIGCSNRFYNICFIFCSTNINLSEYILCLISHGPWSATYCVSETYVSRGLQHIHYSWYSNNLPWFKHGFFLKFGQLTETTVNHHLLIDEVFQR